MTVSITIQHESATGALFELRDLAAGLVTETRAPGGEVSDETQGIVGAESDAPAPEPKRRGRAKKDEAKAQEPATPAPSADVEDAEVVEETPPAEDTADAPTATRDDVKAAMGRYMDAFGMDVLQENMQALAGHARLSLIPDDAGVMQAIVDRFDEAVQAGKPEGIGG